LPFKLSAAEVGNRRVPWFLDSTTYVTCTNKAPASAA
jgi:hypothetical protein